MKKKRTTKIVLIVILAIILVGGFVTAIILIPRFLKNDPPVTMKHEVEFSSFYVSGQNKTRINTNKFYFDQNSEETNVSTSEINVEISEISYVLVEYTISNKSTTNSLQCSLITAELTLINCLLEYSMGESFVKMEEQVLNFEVLPETEIKISLNIKIDNVSINTLCQGNLKLTLSNV